MKDSNVFSLEALMLKVLEVEFKKRSDLKKNYSMRLYADDAKINPSTMSQYLRGKRKLTEESFNTIVRNLGLDNDSLKAYEKEREHLFELQEKHFEVRRQWYYYAILELTYLYDFKADVSWIAKKLDLCENVTKDAIDLLFEIGALTEENGTYIDTLGSVTFSNDINFDVEDGRIYQKQLIEKAVYSIENADGHIKDHTSVCFAFDTSLMPEMKKKIMAFREELIHFANENSKNKDSVYSIQINLNSLTNSNE